MIEERTCGERETDEHDGPIMFSLLHTCKCAKTHFRKTIKTSKDKVIPLQMIIDKKTKASKDNKKQFCVFWVCKAPFKCQKRIQDDIFCSKNEVGEQTIGEWKQNRWSWRNKNDQTREGKMARCQASQVWFKMVHGMSRTHMRTDGCERPIMRFITIYEMCKNAQK